MLYQREKQGVLKSVKVGMFDDVLLRCPNHLSWLLLTLGAASPSVSKATASHRLEESKSGSRPCGR